MNYVIKVGSGYTKYLAHHDPFPEGHEEHGRYAVLEFHDELDDEVMVFSFYEDAARVGVRVFDDPGHTKFQIQRTDVYCRPCGLTVAN